MSGNDVRYEWRCPKCQASGTVTIHGAFADSRTVIVREIEFDHWHKKNTTRPPLGIKCDVDDTELRRIA